MRPLLAGILTLLCSPTLSFAAGNAEKLDRQEVRSFAPATHRRSGKSHNPSSANGRNYCDQRSDPLRYPCVGRTGFCIRESLDPSQSA
jgi:hypothetical protein